MQEPTKQGVWTSRRLPTRPFGAINNGMTKTKKEKATATIRIHPSTRHKLNILAAKKQMTLAEVVKSLTVKEWA